MSEVVTSLADPSANVIFGAVIDDQVRWGDGSLVKPSVYATPFQLLHIQPSHGLWSTCLCWHQGKRVFCPPPAVFGRWQIYITLAGLSSTQLLGNPV